MRALETLFWLLALVVCYAYAGYPLLLRALVALKRLCAGRPAPLPEPEEWPEVTLLVCAYNERPVVEEKMRNCRALDYPAGRLHIMWVTDGSDDGTDEALAAYAEVTVLHQAERRGKTAALNRGVPLAGTPLVVLTDANAMLCPEALREIVRPFTCREVGCVAGEKRVLAVAGDGLAARGEGFYWRYESALKRWDSELYSAMGAAGELYAIRSRLFRPVDTRMLLDDFVLSMGIVALGYRIAYCRTAYACEYGSPSLREERKRKTRIAAGGLQSIWALRALANPLRHPVVAFQLVSHRFLRWSAAPLALALLPPLNAALVLMGAGRVYWLALAGQAAFYLLALLGARVPRYFLFMNWSVFGGALYLARRRGRDGVWEKSERRAAAGHTNT